MAKKQTQAPTQEPHIVTTDLGCDVLRLNSSTPEYYALFYDRDQQVHAEGSTCRKENIRYWRLVEKT